MVVAVKVGADVPAQSFQLSPVDQIFVRMGASDHIMAGQSTFLVELLETASMLVSTSGYIQLIAHLVNCRGWRSRSCFWLAELRNNKVPGSSG